MFTSKFWKDTAERAVRTFVQALIALWAGSQVTDFSGVNWANSLSVAGFAALLSVLMSLAAGFTPTDGEPSFLPNDPDPYEEIGSDGTVNSNGETPRQWDDTNG